MRLHWRVGVPGWVPEAPMLSLLAKLLLAYLLGSIIGGYWVGRLRGGIDLRRTGSGNVGATNALRTQGKMFALAVLLIDAAKGVIAVTVVPILPPVSESASFVHWTPYLCGVAVTIGHVYPVWFGFKGGKGAATLAGVFITLMPWIFLWMLAGFVAAILMSGIVAAGTLVAAAVAVLGVGVSQGTGLDQPAWIFALAMAALVVLTHRSNLVRILKGEENRFDTARLFRRWRER